MYTSPQGHPALTLLREEPTRFANQGTVVTTWRTYRGRRLGPYYRLTWREDGRQRSIYLGRQSPLVDEVRRLLHEAQATRRMIREHRRRQAEFKEHVIRPLQQYVKEMFRLFGNGLYVKGSDIGGIKTAGPRLTTADVPEHLIPKFPLPLPSFLTELHTNPKRERGQQTPSPNTPPSPQSAQETPSHHTNPKRERGQRTSSPSESPRVRRPSELSESVDQNPPHFSAIDLSVIQHPLPPKHGISEFSRSVDQRLPWGSDRHCPSPPQHRHPRAFLEFVDQNRTTRGPPKIVAITLRRDQRRSITRATHQNT